MVATWIKPKLTLDHRMKRLRFTLSQKVPRSLKFKDRLNVIVLDESWFYLHHTSGFVRVFPGDEMPNPVSVRHKSHIPKIRFLTALARSQPNRNFDGRVGIWRICEEKVCDRTTLYHHRGDVYVHDFTLDADLYRQYMVGTDNVDGVFDQINVKMPWLRDYRVIVQQDGSPPHTGHGNVDFFDQEGQKNG